MEQQKLCGRDCIKSNCLIGRYIKAAPGFRGAWGWYVTGLFGSAPSTLRSRLELRYIGMARCIQLLVQFSQNHFGLKLRYYNNGSAPAGSGNEFLGPILFRVFLIGPVKTSGTSTIALLCANCASKSSNPLQLIKLPIPERCSGSHKHQSKPECLSGKHKAGRVIVQMWQNCSPLLQVQFEKILYVIQMNFCDRIIWIELARGPAPELFSFSFFFNCSREHVQTVISHRLNFDSLRLSMQQN